MFSEYLSFLAAHMAELIAVLMVLVILSGRREARATLGWLMLVVFLPYAGALLYVVFGRRHPQYPQRKMHPASVLTGREERLAPEVTSPQMKLTTTITGISPVGCGEIEVMADGATKYERLFREIEGAQKRIVLCYYVFRLDTTGKRLLELLSRRAEQGVEVYLLYDGWGAVSLGLLGLVSSYSRRGVKIKPFAPVANPLKMSRINFRNHRKIAVIDGRIGYTGSTNIGDEYTGISRRHGPWRDLHVRLTGQAAEVLEEVFVEDWRIATGEMLHFEPAGAEPGGVPVHVIPTGPDIEEERLYPLLFAQITRATRSIDIATPYLVPNQGLVAALSVAARQGVRVRLVLPESSNHPMVAAAGRSYYEELLTGGVEIYEMRSTMLHAKACFIDSEWAMIGSANFDNRSFFLNFEINVALSEPAVMAKVQQTFDEWVGASDRIDLESQQKRPTTAKLFDAVCRTLSPVL